MKAKVKDSKKNYYGAGGVYCIGFLGALVYYWQHATTFWMFVWGLIKALFWPGFLVYQLMTFLGMS